MREALRENCGPALSHQQQRKIGTCNGWHLCRRSKHLIWPTHPLGKQCQLEDAAGLESRFNPWPSMAEFEQHQH